MIPASYFNYFIDLLQKTQKTRIHMCTYLWGMLKKEHTCIYTMHNNSIYKYVSHY